MEDSMLIHDNADGISAKIHHGQSYKLKRDKHLFEAN